MSGPSSEGRPSLSTEPSIASSPTLYSRWSGTHEYNGEGSSRNTDRAVPSAPDPNSRGSLDVEAIDELDFAHRKPRDRRSGGFLLDSAFPSAPKIRTPSRQSAYSEDVKGKRTPRHGHSGDQTRHSEKVRNGDGDSLSSSPLSRDVDMTDRRSREHTRARQTDGELRLPKTRNAGKRQSVHTDEAPRSAIDPNQIVHMALNLSESRRRNLSAGQLIAPQPTASPRISSMASIGVPHDRDTRDHGAGSSLRQYLNEQRRASRNISPFGGKKAPSEDTWARVRKARAAIELKMEYLRLLEFLPPLKPDANAPGNFTYATNNVPGTMHAYLTRTPSYAGKKHDLGRAYNPLQYLRDRRSRARERRPLEHLPDEFADIDEVRNWVDRVEKESQYPEYRLQDGVRLPKFHEDHTSNTAPTTRPRMGWFFTSEELLADVDWLEREGNKHLIEDRLGRKIFPKEERQSQDFLQPRPSKEYSEKRRKSWVEGLPGVSADPATGDESDQGSERGRRRRLLPAFRAESPMQKKHGWRGTRSRSRSDSTDTDRDLRKSRSKSRGVRSVSDMRINTGPLDLHLKDIMEREAREAKANSPSIISPDTPDKWGVGLGNIPDSKTPRSSIEVTAYSNGSTKDGSQLGSKMPPNRWTGRSLSTEPGNEPRSSYEEHDSTAPNTPLFGKHMTHTGDDLSPPPSRDGDTKKRKKSKLDMFRSDDSGKAQRYEPDSAGADKKWASRQVTEEFSDGGGLGTALSVAPSAVKSLLSHRKDDSVSSLNSPDHRKEYKDPKESSSAVTRFFKGVKNEGSKVGEFIFRKDRPADDSETESMSFDQFPELSDEDDVKQGRRIRPTPGRSVSATTASSLTSKSGTRYHVELPSFRSHHDTEKGDALAPEPHIADDHVSIQARARANSRSPRFDRLAPPRMDLRNVSPRSSPGQFRAHSPEFTRDSAHKVRGLSRASTSNTFGDVSETSSTTSRPRLNSRHWSITDDNGNPLRRSITATANIVTPSEIARIRALFLCSGIKAREIASRAQKKRPQPPAFLTNAAHAANADLIPIPRKEEHALAARMLVRNLEASASALQTSAEGFRDATVKELTSVIGGLKSRIEADLIPRVRSSGDEALRITSEVSATAPLAVKQISDEIDYMIRMRRRRMRWVRRVGWMLVEWMLLGVMWWAWLVVVVLGTVRRGVGVGWSVVKWLFWIESL